MSNVKNSAPNHGARKKSRRRTRRPWGKARKRRDPFSGLSSSSEVLVRLGRTPLRYRFVCPVAPAIGRGLLSGLIPRVSQAYWLACDIPRSDARDACFPSSCGVVARRSWPPSPRFGAGSLAFGVPEDRGADRARWPPSPPASCLSQAAPIRQADRASGRRRSPLLRFVSPSAYAGRAVLVRDCRSPDYPAAALTPFPFPPAAAPTILAGVRLALAVFIRAVAPELPIPVARFALFWIHRNVFGVAPRVIRARVLRYLSRVLRNGPAAGHCRGLAEFHFSSPDVLHSTSYAAMLGNAHGVPADCPSQLFSGYNFSVSAGVLHFRGHAPTCRRASRLPRRFQCSPPLSRTRPRYGGHGPI